MTTSSSNAPFHNPLDPRAPTTSFPDNRMSGMGDGQWGAIAAGAVTGLAATVLMATLGAALGLTTTAAAVDADRLRTATAAGAEQAAAGFGIGAGIWLLISAATVGIVGGMVLAKLSNAHRAYSPGAHGLLTWSLGITLAAGLAVSGSGAVATAFGIGGAGAAGAVASRTTDRGMALSDATRPGAAANERNAGTADAGFDRRNTEMTPEERAAALRAAEVAATAAATATWFALIAMGIGLGTTIWAASRRKYQGALVAGRVSPA